MNRTRFLVVSALAIAVGASGSGCASTDTEDPVVYTADATEVVATFQDGFAARPVGVPKCSGPDATYTLRLPSRELTTARCGAVPTTKVLAPADATALDAALKALRIQTTKRCYEDTPAIRITIRPPSREKTFRDGESFCQDDGAAYVEGAGSVVSELAKLSE